MVQVHVLAREWGFDSPLGHHLSPLDTTLAEDRPDPPPPPTFGRLLASNIRVVAWATALAVLAFGTWRGLVIPFPDAAWLQPKP